MHALIFLVILLQCTATHQLMSAERLQFSDEKFISSYVEKLKCEIIALELQLEDETISPACYAHRLQLLMQDFSTQLQAQESKISVECLNQRVLDNDIELLVLEASEKLIASNPVHSAEYINFICNRLACPVKADTVLLSFPVAQHVIQVRKAAILAKNNGVQQKNDK